MDAPSRCPAWLGRPWFLAFVVTLGLAGAAIKPESLWIDEGNSAFFARQPSAAALGDALFSSINSDAHMPFYMGWLWLWSQAAGSSEIALRCANVPWVFLGIGALLSAMPPLGGRRLMALVALASPFLWYYISEARPYAMQFAGAALCLGMLAQSEEQTPAPPGLLITAGFALGSLLLCGSSLLGIPYAGLAGLVWAASPLRLRAMGQGRQAVLLTVTAAILLALGAYYLHIATQGSRASGIGRTDWLSLGYAIYELIGASGLGPGRLELREHGLRAIGWEQGLGIALLAGSALVLAAIGTRALASRKRLAIGLALYGVIPTIFLLGLGYAAGFRVVGRHLTPLLPLLWLLLAHGSLASWRSGWLGRSVVALYLGLSLLSAIRIRGADAHARDDYRTAAQWAREATQQGQTVWWAADRATGRYYGLAFDHRIIPLSSPDAGHLQSLPRPDVVILSKPDVYDRNAAIREVLGSASPTATAPAFRAYRLEDANP